MRDAIGISMSTSKLLKIKMDGQDIKGVICSTNKRPGMIKTNGVNLQCDTKIRGNE